jgi:hypothetical protein
MADPQGEIPESDNLVSDPVEPPEPQRIQLRRTKGWRKPEGSVVVARPTKWGNPVSKALVPDPVDLVRYYEKWIELFPHVAQAARRELRGHDLACWCPLNQPCHADVLLKIANK